MVYVQPTNQVDVDEPATLLGGSNPGRRDHVLSGVAGQSAAHPLVGTCLADFN